MLRDLHVSDLALIEDLTLEFGPGLNVISGETGAGKSLLQRAVAISLGSRTASDVIRGGKDTARVEARYVWPPESADLEARVRARGVPVDEEADLRVRRTVSRVGRGQVAMNGKTVPLSVLVEVGAALAQLQGQHESLRLAHAESHLEMLDEFADTTALAGEYRERYAELADRIARLEALERGAADLERRLEMARYDLDELVTAGVEDAAEGELLANERSRLRNSGRLASSAAEALERLHAGEGAALGAVERYASTLRDLADLDPALDVVATGLEQASSPLADAVHELQSYVDGLDSDPQRLEAIEERLALLDRLQRKHRAEDVEGLLARRNELEREIDRGEHDQSNPEALQTELDEAASEAWRVGDALSDKRRAAAKLLAKRMKDELATLAMADAEFSVEFESLAPSTTRGAAAALVRDGRALGPDGPHRAEFFLEANTGEGAMPLARVASGGELSRLMLALRNVTGAGTVPTLVFDEVDAGIGGAAAEIVGRRLRDLGQRHQVICITHLPQIAAFADRHYSVEKRKSGGRTRTRVVAVDGQDRIRELARMLGDADPGEEALRHAEEILKRATAPAETTSARGGKRRAKAAKARAGEG
ncbi:MAG: DNA repair protein RecN [Candidatus Binatia bacterium]|nr:DNA repair protein RecN [Candidatus Binatia bacterium]